MNKPRITEKAFQEQVRKAALIHGWRAYRAWISIHSASGFPDLCMVHAKKQRLIFAELKAEGKEPTAKQREWLDDLGSCAPGAVEAYCWHPSDIDAIWEILKR